MGHSECKSIANQQPAKRWPMIKKEEHPEQTNKNDCHELSYFVWVNGIINILNRLFIFLSAY